MVYFVCVLVIHFTLKLRDPLEDTGYQYTYLLLSQSPGSEGTTGSRTYPPERVGVCSARSPHHPPPTCTIQRHPTLCHLQCRQLIQRLGTSLSKTPRDC